MELLTEDLVVVSSAALPPPAGGGSLTVSALRDEPMVMFRHGYDLRDLTVAACRAEGFEPVFTVEGGEMDAVLGFVRAGLGIAVVPAMVADRAGSGLRATPWRAPPAPHDRPGPPHGRGTPTRGPGAEAHPAGLILLG